MNSIQQFVCDKYKVLLDDVNETEDLLDKINIGDSKEMNNSVIKVRDDLKKIKYRILADYLQFIQLVSNNMCIDDFCYDSIENIKQNIKMVESLQIMISTILI